MPFEQLCTFDALRLFAARAQAVDQTFQLEPDNISLVDAICRQLDGLPLAIELAASHLRHYPLREILTRLEHRLAFLNNGPRDVIPRHQTLLATIGWSETLLGPTARQVFRRLSVLVDGWTPEALAAVCSLTEAEGQAILHTLLDHHLVYRLHPTSDEHRFGMLEMIREYALHQLHNAGEEAAIRTRHLAYYIQFVEPIEGYLGGEHQLRWLDSLTAAYPNIRAALAWTLAAELVEAGVQLGGALCRYWELTSQYLEGRDWIERVLAQAGAEANTCHYARAIQALARTYITKPAQAIPITQRALEAIRQTDDIWRTASILSDQGRNWWGVGEFARAEEYCLQSLALRRQIGDQGEIGSSLLNLGTLAFNQADFSKAVRFYQEGLALFRRVGDLNGIAMMLNNLGAVARERGDYARAEQTLREALVVRTQIGVVGGIVMTTVNLAWVSAAQANTQLARQYLREALRLAADVKEEVALDWFMEVFVRIRLAENAIESAMEWYGAAQYEALRGEVPYDQLTLAWYSATLSAAEEQLGNERVAAAIQRGHVLAESQSLAAMLKHLQDAVG
jgi:tetratricopeptide (TPR) repeat protein